MTWIAIAYSIGDAAPVAESIPAQAFHLVAPVYLFNTISAHRARDGTFVDSMEGVFVHSLNIGVPSPYSASLGR